MAQTLPEIRKGAPFIFQVGENNWAQITLLKDLEEGTFEVSPIKVDTVIFNSSDHVRTESSIVHNEYKQGGSTHGKTYIG